MILNEKDTVAVQKRAAEVFMLARTLVGAAWPYLTAAVMRLVPRWTDSVPTMGVDRHMRLYMRPLYVAKLKPTGLAVLLAGHELQHVLGRHCDRLVAERDIEVVLGGATTTSLANACHDLAINSGLEAFVKSAEIYRSTMGLKKIEFEIPKGAIYPHMFSFPVGLVSEEYVPLMRSRAQQGNPGGAGNEMKCGTPDNRHSCGSGGGDKQTPWEEGEPDGKDPSEGATEVEVDVVCARVAQAAIEQEQRCRGSVPGRQRLWAEAHLKPSKIPWRQLLRRAVRSGVSWAAGRTEWSYQRPCRWNPPRVILPSMVAPEPSLVCAFDTSGSMGPSDYDTSFREAHAVLRSIGFRKVPVFTCDTEIGEIQYVSDVTEIKMTGGGGTDMGNAIAAAELLGKKLLIVFTDGVTPYGEKPDNMRVIVCLTQKPSKSYPVPDWATAIVCED